MSSALFNIRTWQGKVVASTAVAAGVFGLYLIARKPKRANRDMSVDRLVTILEAFAQAIDECGQNIAKQEKMVRQRMKLAGRAVSDEDMFRYCQSEFENAMEAKEASIYQQFKTSESACKQAWHKYRDNETVAKLESRILMAASVFEQPEVELPESFTEAKLLQLNGELVEATTKAMEETIAELAKRGVTGDTNKSQFVSQFQKLFQQKTQKIQVEIPLKYGVSDAQYNAAAMKYQDSPVFQAQMEQLKANQMRIFQEAGL